MSSRRENFQSGVSGDGTAAVVRLLEQSSAYRVRIALGLKGLAYERSVVNRLDGVDEPGYHAVNAQGFVPTLEVDGLRLVQSTADLGVSGERWPQPALLPATAGGASTGAGTGGAGGQRYPAA